MNYDPDELIRTNAKLGCRSWSVWDRLSFSERGQTLWYFSDLQDTLFNSVLDCEVEVERLKPIVSEVAKEADERKVPVAWMVNRKEANSKPHRAVLAENGFSERGSTLGMVLPLNDFKPERSPIDTFRIQPVRTRPELRMWAGMVMSTYGFPTEMIAPWEELHASVGLDDEAPWKHYLVFPVGKSHPVGASSLFTGEEEEQASFANLAVAPSARGKGLGSAVTEWCLGHAKELGYSVLTLYASSEAVALYRKLGFESYHTNRLFYRGL